MKEKIIDSLSLVKTAFIKNKNIRKLWIFGMLLVIASLITQMYLLALSILLLTLFFTFGNIDDYREEVAEEIDVLIKDKERVSQIYADLKQYSEENTITLQERRELKELELEIKELEEEIKHIEEEKQI